MTSRLEKGGGSFQGIKLLLCENPLPPLDEAIAAAQRELPRSNYYTEAYSAPLRKLIAGKLSVPEASIHVNAGSELILRQLFDRFGQQVHLLTPTYPLFPEIAQRYTETRLLPENSFAFDLARASEAAAIATLRHEDKIRERAAHLRGWAQALAGQLRALGIRTFPSETYFFLADFAPHNAGVLATRLQERGVLVKALQDPQLGSEYMRITTALPEDNARFLSTLAEIL